MSTATIEDRLVEAYPQIQQELASRAERSLSTFVQCAWHVVEPATEFVPGFHLHAICEHLESVSNGTIRNLLINIPPRHMKSLTVSVFWPVWEWLKRPDERWLYSSYALSLSIRDSLKCRRLIESQWFQKRWGDRFVITGDQNAKMKFENDKSGYRIATSVGGSATGEGGSKVIVDDPHNITEQESDAIRESTLIWWDETMSTRLNDPKTGAKIIVMQRVHSDDLAGHVLKQGGYTHLCLPAEYEPSRKCVTDIGWEDPRQNEGDLLWKDRIGPAEIAELKRRLGPSGYAGQFQQRPTPAGGNLFKLEWFNLVQPDQVRPLRRTVRAWDFAATEKSSGTDPDWTVGVKMGVDDAGDYWIIDVKRERASPAGVEKIVRATAIADGYGVAIRLEQEPGSSGKALVSHYQRNVLEGYAVNGVPATGDKVTRAHPFSSAAERGAVHLLAGEWVNTFLDELMSFPAVSHDDQVDAAVNAFAELTQSTRAQIDSGFYVLTGAN